jgi:hypothetical protein
LCGALAFGHIRKLSDQSFCIALFGPDEPIHTAILL